MSSDKYRFPQFKLQYFGTMIQQNKFQTIIRILLVSIAIHIKFLMYLVIFLLCPCAIIGGMMQHLPSCKNFPRLAINTRGRFHFSAASQLAFACAYFFIFPFNLYRVSLYRKFIRSFLCNFSLFIALSKIKEPNPNETVNDLKN